MKVNAELDLEAETTKDQLIAALDGIPGNAVISIRSHEGGWGSSTWHTMKFTWEVGNGKPTYNVHQHGSGEWGTGLTPR